MPHFSFFSAARRKVPLFVATEEKGARERHHLKLTMALLSGLFHEGEAAERLAEERRAEKYGGEQKVDTIVDLSEKSIPGVLMKKIVRPGNGELPPVPCNVSG